MSAILVNNSLFHVFRWKVRLKLGNNLKWLTTDAPAVRIKKKKRVEGQVLPEIKQYLQSKPCLQVVSDFIPERFLRIKSFASYYSFVVDDEIAAEIADIIKDDIAGDTPVIEANPGLGLLTRYMLKAGARKLLIFDTMFHPMPPLQQLISDNPERVAVIPSNIFEVYKVIAQDNMDNGDRFEAMFKDITFRKWEDEPCLKVIGVLQSSNYIKYLSKAIACNDTIIKMGRIENILIMSEPAYRKLTTPKRGRLPLYILFNKFFDMQLMRELPRSGFLPWDKGKDIGHMSNRVMYLVKVTPKPDIFKCYTQEELKGLWFFIQEFCRSKPTKVVAFFETWAPSSGLRLIKEGLNPLTEVGDLSVPEVMELFHIFISLPEYEESNFIHILESELLSETTVEASENKKDESPVETLQS